MVIIFNYKINEKIGKGSFSSVYIANKIDNKKQDFAIKVIKMNKVSEQTKENKKLEVEILSKVNHNNIIKLYDSFYHDGLLYMVFEKCDNDLHTEINGKKNITIETKIEWIKQLMSALIYLHKNKIIHRDLKPQNVLLSKNNQLKIIDFGFSRYFESEDLMNTICGSPLFMSPELFVTHTYDYKSDYWSMGIIIYLILVGHMPYNAKNIMDLIAKLKNITDIKIPLNIKNIYDDDLINMVELMLITSTKYRINHDDLLKHPFIVQNKINGLSINTILNKSSNCINEMINYDDYISPSSVDTGEVGDFCDTFDMDEIFSDKFDTDSNTKTEPKTELKTDSDTNSDTESDTESDTKNLKLSKTPKPPDPIILNIQTKTKPIPISVSDSETKINRKKINLNISYTNTTYTKSIPIPIPIPKSDNNSNFHEVKLNSSDNYSLNNTFIYKNYFSAPVDDMLTNNIKSKYESQKKSYLDIKPLSILNNTMNSVHSSLSELISQSKNPKKP
jgi:serine/threonine protein kinase